jgi:hypothetical protein
MSYEGMVNAIGTHCVCSQGEVLLLTVWLDILKEIGRTLSISVELHSGYFAYTRIR